MEIDDISLYDSFRYRVLEEMVEETKQKSGYFIMIVDKKSLGIISGAVSVIDLTERGVTVIESLEKQRKPMPEIDALYFLTPTHKSVTRLTADYIEQVPYRQAHVFFTGRLGDKLMRTIANSSIMPYIRTFKEANCGFRVVGRDAFSLESSGLLSNLYLSKSPAERAEVISYISQGLAAVCGVMHELPYICYQSESPQARELAMSLEKDVENTYRKLPELPIKPTRPVLMIIDRSYDLAIPLAHDVHYEALLKDLFEVGPEGKVKYESADNSGGTSIKEAVINEKDPVWAKLRYEEVDEAQAILTEELKTFRNMNQAIEKAGNEGEQDIKTMAKVVSGLSNYNDTVSKFAVHRFLLESCMKSFAEEGITESSEMEQMILTGFDNERNEYKESDMVARIVRKIQALNSGKDKLRLAMLAVVAMELSASDRKAITEQLSSDLALHITKLSGFGISLQAAGKTKKRLSKLYINSLKSRIPSIKKIFSYAIPKLADYIFAAKTNTLESEGFAFGRNAPPATEDLQPKVQSVRKKKNAVSQNRIKVIVFILGGIGYSEIRLCKDFPEIQIVMGGTKVVSPLEFVDEIIGMGNGNDVPDIDPRDIEIDFR